MHDNEIACDSCGLTMGQSKRLAQSGPVQLTTVERNLLGRFNDCNKEITPADRSMILKLIERLQNSEGATSVTPSTATQGATLTDEMLDRLLGESATCAEDWNVPINLEWMRAYGRAVARFCAPIPVADSGATQALRNLRDALRMRHHGRMPEEVQTAYDAANALLAAAKPVSVDTETGKLHQQYAGDMYQHSPLDETAFNTARARMGTNTQLQDRMLYQSILAYMADLNKQE